MKITNMPSGLNVFKTVTVPDTLVAFGFHRFFLLKALCVVVFCETPLEVCLCCSTWCSSLDCMQPLESGPGQGEKEKAKHVGSTKNAVTQIAKIHKRMGDRSKDPCICCRTAGGKCSKNT